MAEFRKVKQQIKYSLDNLRAKNAFHDFETICRHFSRKRLGLNIQPATGPVSAGGDQGRDFESYTIIHEVQNVVGKDKAVITKRAAFACTIQSDNLSTKIKNDVKTIIEKGRPIEIIYFFSVKDIDISKRHRLQKWAFDEYNIELEIFDGEALSEELASNDLFWIAEEYLDIPADIFPKVDDIDYLKIKEKWKEREPRIPNYSVLDEVRSLARRALFDKNFNQDLSFWLSKLEKFLDIDTASFEFRRKVLYELVAIRIRGMRDLRGREKYVSDYFNLCPGFNNQIEAQEACVVWIYAYSAFIRGAGKFESNDLKRWRKAIEDYAEEELKKDYSKPIKAVLYELKGHLSITNPYQVNIDEGMEWWLRLASIIEETPLFPLERFCDILTVVIDYIGDHPKFGELVDKTNKLLAKRVGGFALAEKCRDRAIKYKEKGDLIKALQELHKVKINWFAQETLYGSLLSMMLISEIYFELGLIYAAKYYAMVVSFIASGSTEDKMKPFIARGFSKLSECEYANGEWAHFLEHTELTLKSMAVYSKDLDDPVSREIYEKQLFYAANVYAFTYILDKSKIFKYVQRRIAAWDMDELRNDLIPLAKETWSKTSTDKLIQKIQSEFRGVPFNDVGLQRESKWEANGIKWRFVWENDLHKNAKAEQLICLIQILLAEIADKDLYLLETSAEVKIKYGDRFHIEHRQSNNISKWLVTLPLQSPRDRDEIKDYNSHTLGIAGAIIADLSLLPSTNVMSELKSLFKEGLTDKIFSGNSYEVVYVPVTRQDLYEEIIALNQIDYLSSIDFSPKTHKALLWKDSLLQEYDRKEVLSKIRSRYRRSIVPIKKTIQKLNKNTSFQEVVKRLRADKWKDWHILMALVTIAVNYRVNKIGYSNLEEMKELFSAQMEAEESEASIFVPLSEFNEKAIRSALSMTMLSTLKIFGLESKGETPNTQAIQTFLGRRLNYWDDDSKHEDMFKI